MKAGALRTFLGDLLSSRGAEVVPQGPHLLEVRPRPKLAAQLGRTRLLLAFTQRGLQENPASELATVGNPVFDRILELALEEGKVGERFRMAKAKRRGSPDPRRQLEGGENLRLGAPVPVYTPIYFLVYRIQYSLEEMPGELEFIPVDAVTLDSPHQTPDVVELWESLASVPEPERTRAPAYPIPPEVVRASLAVLEKRLRKRLSKIRQISDGHLSHETRSIEAYYQQLIHEAKNTGRRWSASSDEREERIQLLQLDWRRRIEEAQEFWRPHVDVSLAAVGAVQQPRLAYRVDAAKPHDEPRGEARAEARGGPHDEPRGGPRDEPRGQPHAGPQGDWPETIYFDEVEERFILPAKAAEVRSMAPAAGPRNNGASRPRKATTKPRRPGGARTVAPA